MSLGQFMPVYSPGAAEVKDPYAEFVIMDLTMENVAGDGFTLVDRSMHRNTFTRSGNAHLSGVEKKFGKTSAYFDGTGDYYYSEAKALYNQPSNFTVELWFNPTVLTSGKTAPNRMIISHATSSSWNEPTIYISGEAGNNIIFKIAAATRITGQYIMQNTWYHLSYGRIDGKWFLYINGVLQGSYSNAASLTGWSTTLATSGWARTTNTDGKFTGHIDHLRWWKGVSVRDGVTNFTPPKGPWAEPPKSIFTPVEVVSGVMRSSWWGYNKTADATFAAVGSISGQPFEGFPVKSVDGHYEGMGGYWSNITLEGTYTVEQFEAFKRKIPSIRVRRGTTSDVFNGYSRSATGVCSLYASVSGDRGLFANGQTTFIELAP